ncbi:dodecin family protein, partial [Gemmatimonas sp.]
MSVAKVIEIISSSTTSFDDAVSQGIAKASETITG